MAKLEIKKEILDEDKELFLGLFWLIPTGIQICVMVTLSIIYSYFLWVLLITSILWFLIIGSVYYFFHTVIIIENDKIKIINRRKEREINFSDILCIEETFQFRNSYHLHRYEFFFKQDSMGKSIVLRNKKIQKNMDEIFKDVKIITKTILD